MTTRDQSTAPMQDHRKPAARQLQLRAYVNGVQVGSLLVSEGRIRVGRAPGNELVIEDPTVSSHHLEAHFTHGGLLVRDLATKNGTKYRGSLIREALLPPGAVLTLGAAELRIEGDAPPPPLVLGPLVAVAPAMRLVFQKLQATAGTQQPVLLRGEAGTGKEEVARALHAASARAQGPFIVLRCDARTPEELDEELFGPPPGQAGASPTPGPAFARASGGTLLLDEVSALPPALQARLLELLQTTDVRVLSATQRNLDEEVAAGRFHAQLRAWLGRNEVVLPLLRERPEDIPSLVLKFLSELGERARGFQPSIDLLGALAEHPWHGNIRELREFVERAFGPTDASPQEPLSPGDYSSARARALEEFERHFVIQLLKSHGHNVSRAAREAGISRIHLHRLIKKHGLTS